MQMVGMGGDMYFCCRWQAITHDCRIPCVRCLTVVVSTPQLNWNCHTVQATSSKEIAGSRRRNDCGSYTQELSHTSKVWNTADLNERRKSTQGQPKYSDSG
jgi:hypothetical protein